jgi:hypothetical protein
MDMATDERTRKWRKKQVEERMEELSDEPPDGQGFPSGVLWNMAEQRVLERQRRKWKFLKLVNAEYERLWKEAEQALVMEYEHRRPD